MEKEYSNFPDEFKTSRINYLKRRNRRKWWFWVITICVILFLAWFIYRWNTVSAMAATDYGRAVHVCISDIRGYNQNAWITINPQKCIANPYVIR